MFFTKNHLLIILNILIENKIGSDGSTKVFVLSRFLDINNVSDSISIDSLQLFESPSDFLSLNNLNVWNNTVFGTEINAFLMCWKTSNNASGDTFSLGDQLHLVNWMWVQSRSELDKGTSLSEKWEVDTTVVLGGDGVDNEVKFGVFAGHGVLIF